MIGRSRRGAGCASAGPLGLKDEKKKSCHGGAGFRGLTASPPEATQSGRPVGPEESSPGKQNVEWRMANG